MHAYDSCNTGMSALPAIYVSTNPTSVGLPRVNVDISGNA